MSSPRSGAPSLSAAGATSSRSQSATSSAIVQRSVAGGATATFAWSGRITRSRRTASTAPHSPGPASTGIGLNTAIFANRSWQTDGAGGTDGAAAAPPDSGNEASPAAASPVAQNNRAIATRPFTRQISGAMAVLMRKSIGAYALGGQLARVLTGLAARLSACKTAFSSPPQGATLGPARRPSWWRRIQQEQRNARQYSRRNTMLGLMQDWPLLLPSHHRSCRAQSRRAAGHHPLDRRADAPHQLRGNPRAGIARGAAARTRRHQARRPRGDAGLEYLAAPGKLVWHSSASALSITPSIRGCSPSRSPGSSITRKTA